MAGTTSISGLASGLDTATIISQLMQLESQTQTRLKSRLSTEQSQVKSLQDLNSKLASLATSAAELTKPANWSPVKVSSSSDKVAVSAGAGALTAPLSFTVDHAARAHSLSFATTAALTDTVTSGSTMVKIDYLDGNTLEVETGDGTLSGLVSALNASGTGVKAGTIRLDDGSYRLQVISTETGEAADFTLANLDDSPLLGGATATAGRDAQITIGGDVLHSASNTFSDVANGLSLTLQASIAEGTEVDVEVSQDSTAMTAKVKALVTAVNEALTKIDSLTNYDAATETAGPLAGDAGLRAVRDRLLETVYPTDGTSLAAVGIQVDRNGKLTFDEAKFGEAYAADPGGVADRFTTAANGFAARVQSVAKGASDPIDGTITSSIKTRNSGIDRLEDDISNWDVRLQLREETLTRQFTALETALSQMNSQSDWLASQIASFANSDN